MKRKMMSGEFKVLMVASSGPEESVFESQVLDIVRAWRNHGEVSLRYRSKSDSEIKVDGVDVGRIRDIAPALGRLPLYLERLVNDQWTWLGGYDLVHCRGIVAAWQVLRSMSKQQRARVKVLYDCRGITVEEIEGMWSTSWKRALLPLKMSEMRRMENFVVNEVDILTTVSEGLSDYLFDHYGRRPDLIIRPVVNPDKFYFSAVQRDAVRKQMGVCNTDRLFLFVGGGDYWQSLGLLKCWWDSICRPNFTLLILTHKPSDYDSWLKEVSNKSGRVIVKSVPHSEVSSYMCASDFGILFRDSNLVNNVASPVKLSEYLCTGLQVLTNLTVYKSIQPEDIHLVNLSSVQANAEYVIRDNNERENRAAVNMNRFSAETAVKKIYDYVGQYRKRSDR